MFHTSTKLFPPRPAVKWGRKWLVDFDAGKTQLVLQDRSYKTGVIDVKMDGSVTEETLFKMLVLLLNYLYH